MTNGTAGLTTINTQHLNASMEVFTLVQYIVVHSSSVTLLSGELLCTKTSKVVVTVRTVTGLYAFFVTYAPISSSQVPVTKL